jgi:hypothetical protein
MRKLKLKVKSMKRPEFTKDMTITEFNSYYWYRKDLIDICKRLGLDNDGSKSELEHRLKNYLNGVETGSNRKKLNKKRMNNDMGEISLDMKIIEGGFRFNSEARTFFKNYFNTSKFSFTREMGLAVRAAEENNDLDMNVQDLIDIYTHKKEVDPTKVQTSIKTCQWNNFYKDFCNDPRNKIFKNKMKVASILWNIIKESREVKKYNHRLVEENMDLIKNYI